MHRSRLLLAVPAATALVLAGGSPAWAGGDGHDHGDDAWAKIVDIADEAELEDDGDVLEVTFSYKCEDADNGEEVTADVTAKNRDDIRYEADDAELDCTGDEEEATVPLDEEDGEAEAGDRVKVTVTLSANGDELDEESEWVEVVDEENGDDDGDKDDRGDHGKH